MLELDIRKQAVQFVKRLPPKHADQIGRKLALLLINPYPPDSKKLSGLPLLRTDVGEYRIAYQVYGTTLLVPLIGKRNDSDIYRRLERMFR